MSAEYWLIGLWLIDAVVTMFWIGYSDTYNVRKWAPYDALNFAAIFYLLYIVGLDSWQHWLILAYFAVIFLGWFYSLGKGTIRDQSNIPGWAAVVTVVVFVGAKIWLLFAG